MKKLEVPQNIPLRWELWRGVGAPELIRTLVCTIVLCVVFTAISALLTDWQMGITAVFSFILLFVVFGSVFSKIDNNQSVYEYLQRSWRFHKSQKKYFYRKEKEVIYIVPDEDRDRQ